MNGYGGYGGDISSGYGGLASLANIGAIDEQDVGLSPDVDGPIEAPPRPPPPEGSPGFMGPPQPSPRQMAVLQQLARRGATPAGGMGSRRQGYLDTLSEQIERRKELADREADILSETATKQAFAQQAASEGMQGFMESQRARKAAIDKQLEAGMDPDRAWDAMGTAGKIANTFAIAIGAFTEGFTGGRVKNVAMRMVNDVINKDIAAQRLRLKTLGLKKDDINRETDRYRINMLESAKQSAGRIGMMAQAPMAKIQAAKDKMALDGQLVEARQKMAEQAQRERAIAVANKIRQAEQARKDAYKEQMQMFKLADAERKYEKETPGRPLHEREELRTAPAREAIENVTKQDAMAEAINNVMESREKIGFVSAKAGTSKEAREYRAHMEHLFAVFPKSIIDEALTAQERKIVTDGMPPKYTTVSKTRDILATLFKRVSQHAKRSAKGLKGYSPNVKWKVLSDFSRNNERGKKLFGKNYGLNMDALKKGF